MLNTLAGRHIELWVEARGGEAAVNPVMRSLLRQLSARGASVSVRVPEHQVFDPLRLPEGGAPDLVLLKSATTLALSLALADELGGGRFLNSARNTLRAHDKAAAVARLAAAGLPVPTTFLRDLSGKDMTTPLASEDGMEGAWVVKPVRGVHGHGVSVHSDFAEALNVGPDRTPGAGYVVGDGVRLFQRYIGAGSTQGETDVKVYVAGGAVFAGRKPFSASSYASDEIVECPLGRSALEIVHAAGEALGLRCFGVDLRFDGDRPVIIDANPFPGYRGFPGAVPALLSEIVRALEGAPCGR